jgi:hypothetical protein
MTGQTGVIYLLCFTQPYRHARHYTGKSESSAFLKAGSAGAGGCGRRVCRTRGCRRRVRSVGRVVRGQAGGAALLSIRLIWAQYRMAAGSLMPNRWVSWSGSPPLAWAWSWSRPARRFWAVMPARRMAWWM